MKNILLTGADGDFERHLAGIFAREGYRVFVIGGCDAGGVISLPGGRGGFQPPAGEHCAGEIKKHAGGIDIYIDTSDGRDDADNFSIRDGLDETVIRRLFELNVMRPMAMLEAFLPLIDAGETKRLCFLTSRGASINETRAETGFGYNASKAAMHNFFQMISNKLTPAGYTFRVFDPMRGETEPDKAAEAAFHYFTRRRATERENPRRDDETRLVFRDAEGREHTW